MGARHLAARPQPRNFVFKTRFLRIVIRMDCTAFTVRPRQIQFRGICRISRLTPAEASGCDHSKGCDTSAGCRMPSACGLARAAFFEHSTFSVRAPSLYYRRLLAEAPRRAMAPGPRK